MLFANREKLFFKIPSLLKFLKPPTHNRHDNDSEKPKTDKDFATRRTERQPPTAVWRNAG